MCTVLLPPGVNPIAINKYINIKYTILNLTFNASLGALYRTLISHMLPASVHHTEAKAFKGYYKRNTPPS